MGEERKEFNTEVTESTEKKRRKREAGGSSATNTRLRDSETALEQAQEDVGEDGGIADQGHATEDEGAEATGPDGCSDGCDANGDDRSGANACKDDGERKWKPDAEEDLRAGHAHGFGGFQNRRVDTGKADVSVAEDGKKRVEDEGDDGSALADAADEWNGNEKSEESEAGDGLEDAGDTEGDGSQSGTLHDEHAKGNADENG